MVLSGQRSRVFAVTVELSAKEKTWIGVVSIVKCVIFAGTKKKMLSFV